MTDFRALCAELLDWAERTSAHYVVHPDVILRARAALAQPEPEFTPEEVEMIQAPWSYLIPSQPEPQGQWPTDEELDSFRQEWRDSNPNAESWLTDEQERRFARAVLARWGRTAQSEPQGPTDEDLLNMWLEQYGIGPAMMSHVEFRHAIRDVLARWGRPAVEPVPEEQVLARVEFAEREFNCPSDVVLRQYCDDWFYGDPERSEVDPLDLCRGAIKLFAQIPAPIPVSERLPEAKDVESKVRYCWWFNREDIAWYYCDAAHCDPKVYTQWLPCWALPQQEAGQ